MLLVPIQKLINRFVNLMTSEKDIDVKQVFESSVTVKNMLSFAEEKGIVIDMSYFNEQSTQLVERKMSRMSPKLILKAIELLDDQTSQYRIVNKAIDQLRKDKLDIKKMNFSELTAFVGHVI